MYNTKEEALAEVTKNGWVNVHLTLGDIKRIHGQEQGYVIPEVCQKPRLRTSSFQY